MFDSVGYWYVEPCGSDVSRVYYTQDTLLPAWIPAPLRKTFTRIAMKAATQKLEPACREAMSKASSRAAWMPRVPRLGKPE